MRHVQVKKQTGLQAGDCNCRLVQSCPQAFVTNGLNLSGTDRRMHLQAIAAITPAIHGQQQPQPEKTRLCTSRLSMPSPQVSSVSSSRRLQLRGALLLAGASVPNADTPTPLPETAWLPAGPQVPCCFCPAARHVAPEPENADWPMSMQPHRHISLPHPA